MKKLFKIVSLTFFIFSLCSVLGCKTDYEIDPYSYSANIKPWKFQKDSSSGARTVSLTVTEDIDFLYWTKFNGEVLYTDKNYRFMPYYYSNEKLSFDAREEPYIFDFSGLEKGIYVLNIHYKDIEKNTDNDFRGFVRVFGSVSISDKVNGENIENCGTTCSKQARFTIRNDSRSLLKILHKKNRPGNVMTEFTYVDYVNNSSFYDYTYKTILRFSSIKLEPGKQVDILLPMSRDNNVEKNGFLLKKVINDGEVIYYGNTTTSIYKEGFGAPMGGTINNDFIPKGNNEFYTDWNWRH